jgi:peroxiredoxin family protein
MTPTDGAAAMGDDVTRFFTFWGLNVLRRPEKVMKQANAMSLEELVDSAREQGVKFAGVAAYLGGADEANVNLFNKQLAKPLPRACAETAGPGRKRRRRRSKASAISRPPS